MPSLLPSAPTLRPWRAACLDALALTLVAALVTWPLVTQLHTHVLLGVLRSQTVPLFNLWTLEWNRHWLSSLVSGSHAGGVASYWDAPIFYPSPGAFALSEPQPLTGLVFSALAPWVGSIAAYNLILLGLLVLVGVGARRVLLLVGAPRSVALLTGALMMGMPFLSRELGVLQQLALFPVLFALGELWLLSTSPTPGALLRLALWIVLLALGCVHHALLFSVPCLLAVPWILRRSQRPRWRARQLWGSGCLALGLAFALLAPFALGQRAVLSSYQRSAADIRGGSATARQYTRERSGTLGAVVLPFLGGAPRKKSLFPGVIVLGLAVFGARSRQASERRAFVLYLVAFGLVAWLASFGTRLALFGVSPYALSLQAHWPGFGQLRSPYRFAALVHVACCLLAGFGLWAVHARLATQRRTLWLALIALAASLEVVPLGEPSFAVPVAACQAPWVAWLRAQPAGAVIMAPGAVDGKTDSYQDTTVAMLCGLRHGHPLVNGYSGFFPPEHDRLLRALRRFPERRSQALLRGADVRFVVADDRWVAAERDRSPQRVWPRAVHASAGHTVFELAQAALPAP